MADPVPAATFADRHIGPRPHELAAVLETLEVTSLDELLDQVVPEAIRSRAPLEVPAARSEPEALARLREMAARNRPLTSLIGMGYYGTHTPGVIRRNVFESPGWYTAYTPYQPEISQGRLEALLVFQTMVGDLVGLDIANASMLDEASAAAEAMTMARRAGGHGGTAFFVDADTHPQTVAVVATRAEPLGIEVVVGDPGRDLDPRRCSRFSSPPPARAVVWSTIGPLQRWCTSTGAWSRWPRTCWRAPWSPRPASRGPT